MSKHKSGSRTYARQRTYERIEKLRAGGATYADIAKRLDVSIGMVAGCLHRVKVKAGVDPKRKPKGPQAPKRPYKRVNVTYHPPVKAAREIDLKAMRHEPVPLGDRPGGCQWLHGEATDRLFCGHGRRLGSAYCDHHHARSFTTVPKGKN